MNKERRERLRETVNILSRVADTISSIKDEEQFAYDNLPESFQMGEQGDKMEEVIDCLDDAITAIGEAIESVGNSIDG